ncbi:GntR family transcriptional regulator [Embleya sp. AB8]|uniref:GntR family transcriptional regulator n=1 Tax=Embleya sp. AB8 TaxID=3156304 RepID=UPI003C7607A4
MTPSPTARPKSRTVLARELIRGRILRLEMPPGTVFNEGDLAAALDLGKTPVREALNLLTHESLVAVAPHSGYLVMPVTLRDIREVVELRLSVEPLPARLAALGWRGAADARGLDAAAAAWWRAVGEPGAGVPPAAIVRLGWGAVLAERAGNSRAAEVEEYVLRHQLRHLRLAAALGRPCRPVADPGALPAALAAADPEAAATAVEADIRALGAALSAALTPAARAYLGRPDTAGRPADLPIENELLDLDLGRLHPRPGNGRPGGAALALGAMGR